MISESSPINENTSVAFNEMKKIFETEKVEVEIL